MTGTAPSLPWEAVRTQALLGTDRQPAPPASPVDGPVEAALLAAALVESTRRRVGTVPRRHGLDPSPAPEEPQPFASARAGQLLELLLAGQVGGVAARGCLLELWLRHCVDAGLVAPLRTIPQILDSAGDLDRDLVAQAIGERGRWLATQNPAWRRPDDQHGGDATTEPPDDWVTLPARQRAEVIRALRPSPENESFLEDALGDRARSVRRAAAVELAELPCSQRAQRMRGRLAPLLRPPGRLRSMAVELPDLPTEDELTDATEDPPVRGSVREWWLNQLIAGAPLDVWPAPPDVVVTSLAKEGTRATALATAVRRQRDRAWAGVLLESGLLAPELFALADATVAEAVLSRAVEGTAMVTAVRAVPGPWSTATSRAVVAALSRRDPATLRRLPDTAAVDLGARLDAGVARDVERWRNRVAADQHPRVMSLLGTVLHVLSLRSELREVFS